MLPCIRASKNKFLVVYCSTFFVTIRFSFCFYKLVMNRTKKIGVLKTAKVAAIVYFVVVVMFLIPFGLLLPMISNTFYPSVELSILKSTVLNMGMFFVLPFVYAGGAFAVTAMGCWMYNVVSNWKGRLGV